MKLLPRSRWGAFLVHLSISFFLLLLISMALFFWWFPGALFSAAGGWEGLRIVAAVDLILGPALTLIVYNISKPRKELLRDLSIIGGIQFVCLFAGVYTVYFARPIVVVQVFDTFYALNRESLRVEGVDEHLIDRYAGFSPRVLYVPVPANTGDFLSQHVKGLLSGEKPQQFRADEYRELEHGAQIVPSLHGAAAPEGCVTVDIESTYRKGKICFDPQTHRFSSFKETP